MDAAMTVADAIALAGGNVVTVGSVKEARAALPGARRLDAGGRAVIPGLIDAHIHLLSFSESLGRVNLTAAATKEEALRRVAEVAARTEPGRWILGGGWNNYLWSPPDFPTRHDLDAVAPNNPVKLDRKDLHSCWVNSAALERAGISATTPNPPGAAIGRDADGIPDGMLYESAVHLVERAIDEPAPDPKSLIRDGLRVLAAMGLTGLHVPEGVECLSALQHLDAAGDLPARIVIFFAYPQLGEAMRLGLRTGFGSARLRLGPVKMFSDGSLGSMTAQMLSPYEGAPGNTGIGTIEQEELEESVASAARAGIASAVHAIGDLANRRVLDAFERVRALEQDWGTAPLVQRIEHVQHLDRADIGRFARLGVVASMQPIHCTSDMFDADRLLGARARYSYALRSLLSSGAALAFGSDAPVETPNPFHGMYAAVTRQDEDGRPAGGWYPEERLTVEEAVRAYTVGAAQASPYLPGVTGTLTPGSFADLLVLDHDIFHAEPGALRDTKPLLTMVGGEATHDPEGFLQG
jgi:predicted amidohydrolase YtcJ